jgi:hypothetical protein
VEHGITKVENTNVVQNPKNGPKNTWMIHSLALCRFALLVKTLEQIHLKRHIHKPLTPPQGMGAFSLLITKGDMNNG